MAAAAATRRDVSRRVSARDPGGRRLAPRAFRQERAPRALRVRAVRRAARGRLRQRIRGQNARRRRTPPARAGAANGNLRGVWSGWSVPRVCVYRVGTRARSRRGPRGRGDVLPPDRWRRGGRRRADDALQRRRARRDARLGPHARKPFRSVRTRRRRNGGRNVRRRNFVRRSYHFGVLLDPLRLVTPAVLAGHRSAARAVLRRA
mmetsp:Transcript_3461/g.14601  ORF Transcript_3461/g.14601 Transcript_3461/m.14601 type:complete len:205 (+) Transcript_3461:660-1274(+)